MKEKRREESYAERIGESGAEAGWELLSRRHLEEGRPAPLPSYLKQHPLSLFGFGFGFTLLSSK